MSSMDRLTPAKIALLAAPLIAIASPACAQGSPSPERARSQMVAMAPNQIDRALERWEQLTAQRNTTAGFDAYAGFVLAYPGFPKETLLRVRAEESLENDAVPADRLVAFFDANPPLTNAARARYALALASLQRPDAFEVAREAWRGGTMSSPSEAYMVGLYGGRFTTDDHDARMDALLWQREREAALRMVTSVSPASRDLFVSRLALIGGALPDEAGVQAPANARTDSGYIYNLAFKHRAAGDNGAAADVLANRPAFAEPSHDPDDFVSLALRVAQGAGTSQSVRIAERTDDLFAPGFEVSQGSFVLRDKYTDLMWLGGTNALWQLGDGNRAAPLFYRYGTGAATPLTRAKGFFWAGRAAAKGGNRTEAERYWSMAAEYPDYYYGQLALAELGRPMPAFPEIPDIAPTPEQRAAFDNDRLTQAIRAIARNRRDWRTERALFEAISDKADTAAEMRMVADLARETGLDELAVVAGMTAGEHGLRGFERLGFPTVATHAGANWTMVHAIARQESEFDRTRESHAGALGMMQLMPGTAREEAGLLGMQYMNASLTRDPGYNIRLGDNHFARRMSLYGGAYPLAIASYNAGPGRVREWVALNGDPRRGGIDWVEWIEKIPARFETRYYVMRVIGNAVTYANMNPALSQPHERDIRHYLQR